MKNRPHAPGGKNGEPPHPKNVDVSKTRLSDTSATRPQSHSKTSVWWYSGTLRLPAVLLTLGVKGLQYVVQNTPVQTATNQEFLPDRGPRGFWQTRSMLAAPLCRGAPRKFGSWQIFFRFLGARNVRKKPRGSHRNKPYSKSINC